MVTYKEKVATTDLVTGLTTHHAAANPAGASNLHSTTNPVPVVLAQFSAADPPSVPPTQQSPRYPRSDPAPTAMSGTNVSANWCVQPADSCPGACSGKGTCVMGQCVCHNAWMGPRCSETVKTFMKTNDIGAHGRCPTTARRPHVRLYSCPFPRP